MSIQSILNNEAMSLVPNLKQIISQVDSHAANQMHDLILRRMMDWHKPLELNQEEVVRFEESMIEEFKGRGYM